jgi:acetoin utilization deacetylase AcuC-like enzyme
MSTSGDVDRGSGGDVGEHAGSPSSPGRQAAPPPARPAILVVDDRRFEGHVPPGHHPERPERLHAARQAVASAAVSTQAIIARGATDDELARVHDASFIEALGKLRYRRGYLDPDTYVSPESVDVARLAAGSLVAMVDAMIDGTVPQGVALLRPPGHHARPAQAMGFCLVNNIAVAAAHARARGLGRVAVVDWDVHHGNGTQEMFWRDPHVLFLSTHQFPFYPGTGDVDEIGEGDGAGYTVNVPLAAGGGDAVYAAAFDRVILPVLEAYAPELVLVSAGFDGSARDPLAQMQLSAGSFGWMAREIARVVQRPAKGRVGLVLEGGYDLVALESGLRSAIEGLALHRAEDLERAPDDEGVDRAAQAASKAWAAVR